MQLKWFLEVDLYFKSYHREKWRLNNREWGIQFKEELLKQQNEFKGSKKKELIKVRGKSHQNRNQKIQLEIINKIKNLLLEGVYKIDKPTKMDQGKKRRNNIMDEKRNVSTDTRETYQTWSQYYK